MQINNRKLILLLIALTASQVYSFLKIKELQETDHTLLSADKALFECFRLQAQLNELHIEEKKPDNLLYPLLYHPR
mgnify:CR=1 FL=1|tara:strand:+ start:25265 stop:25492 length:228 start_codon:yes stop_codon:yes gene_type:complete